MSGRIRQLEDALAVFQSGISNERHPLLRDELLGIKYGPEVRRRIEEEATRNKLATTVDALGTLTVGEHGETKFIGRSGGSETLFLTVGQQADDSSDSSDEQDEPDAVELDDDLQNMSITFPLTIVQDGTDEILHRLEGELPSQERAWSLCEAYLAHLSWYFRPIKRDELINEILSPIYKTVGDPNNHSGYHPKSGCGGRCPHLLAVLFNILALGALVDLTLQPCNSEAEKVRDGTGRVFDVSVSQFVFLKTFGGKRLVACCTRVQARASSASSVSYSHKKHLDDFPLLFSLVFCMALGRPPAASRLHIDCALPADEEASLDEDGKPLEGYWHWKLAFTESIVMHAHDVLLAAETPDYEKILDLDRRIRELAVPKVKLYPKQDDEEYHNAGLCMQGYLMSQLGSVVMLAIHRTFFTQALLDRPTNPLKSLYAPSFLAANRCASVLIKSYLHHYDRFPSLCGRFWTLWTHAFSACLILGATVTRCPESTIAPTSLIELDLAVDLFKKGSRYSKRARQALPMLITIRAKATKSYQQFRSQHISPSLDVHLHVLGPECLAIFGGQTRVMSSKLLSRKPPKIKKNRANSPRCQDSQGRLSSSDTSTGVSPEDTPAPSGESSGCVPQNVWDILDDVNPALVDYLSLFPSSVALVDEESTLADEPMSFSPSLTQSDLFAFAHPFPQEAGPSSSSAFSQSSHMMDVVLPHAPQPFSTSPTDVHMQAQQHDIFIPSADNGFAQVMGENGMVDTNGWSSGFASIPGANVGVGYEENMPLGGDHAMLDEQWMSLMRDIGLLAPGDTCDAENQ
ncbi:hypothetical protein EUX98_g3513 [Antrodiella citrinella]|uniref:Transcription factor domain-containing protein n=1 Tax=Antrodiella citrinella TaxID=2447956 RepID=A0A4S4MWB7_9APHY|nr:hypothetical protein EUX98_g3513 [Antrodiella citrinella]